MKNTKYLLFALLFAVSAAWAGHHEGTMAKPSFSASQSTMVSAVVEAIDHETRVVTVRKADGEEITFTASTEARNLDQVSVGDILVAEYVETFSVEVMENEGFEPEAIQAAAMAAPVPPDEPEGVRAGSCGL